MPGLSRRSLLRTTGGMAGTAAVASIAGCSSIPFIGGGGAGYTKWLYAPGTIRDSDHYGFSYTNTNQYENNEDEFDSETYESLATVRGSVEQIGLDFGDLSSQLSFQSSLVITGDYSTSDVANELENADFNDDDEVGGYTIWTNDSTRLAYGVKGSDIVIGSGSYDADTTPPEIVETTINTKRGKEDRYKSESGAFKTLVNKLGSGASVSGRTQEAPDETNAKAGQFANNVASGSRLKISGSTSKFKRVLVFESSGDVDMGDIEDYVEELENADSGLYSNAESINSNKSGRAAVIKVKVPTDEL